MRSTNRSSHSKSRNGCLQCKQRKVKCDERHPVCRNCIRRQNKCEYALASRTSKSSEFLNSGRYYVSSASNAITTTVPESILHYSMMSRYMIQLLRFVHTELPSFLPPSQMDSAQYQRFCDEIFYEGEEMHFLSHLLLALAGIFKYLSMTVPDNNYYNISRYHFSLFLKQYNVSLLEPSENDFSMQIKSAALLPNFCLLIDDTKLSSSTYYKITRDGLSSVMSVGEKADTEIYNSRPEWKVVELLKRKTNDLTFDNGFPSWLHELVDVNGDKDDEESAAIVSVLKVLHNFYSNRHLRATRVMAAFTVHWALSVDVEFIALIEKIDPRAIIVTIEAVKFILENLSETHYNLVWKNMLIKELEYDLQLLPSSWRAWYDERTL